MKLNSDFASSVSSDQLLNLEKARAQDRILWALEKHRGGLALTSSFGIQSSVLLHMVSTLAPETPIVFIDTEHLHHETYHYKKELTEKLGLKLHIYRPLQSAREQEALYGRQWDENGLASDVYKERNKKEPMRRAIEDLGITSWISGQRRQHGDYRAHLPVLQTDGNIEKIYPLIDWNSAQVTEYMQDHNLPYHPLAFTHKSVGDYFEAEDRVECGLHTGLASFDPKI